MKWFSQGHEARRGRAGIQTSLLNPRAQFYLSKQEKWNHVSILTFRSEWKLEGHGPYLKFLKEINKHLNICLKEGCLAGIFAHFLSEGWYFPLWWDWFVTPCTAKPLISILTIQLGRAGAVPFSQKMIKTKSKNIVNFIRKINSTNKEVNHYWFFPSLIGLWAPIAFHKWWQLAFSKCFSLSSGA